MNDSTKGLPAPRHLLADLIRSIAAIPAPAEVEESRNQVSPSGAETRTTANVLRNIAPTHRPLLATLHVLFPALLLPALDLLDRRRVVRWGPGGDSSHEALPPAATGSQTRPPPPPPSLYQIRGDTPHVVHLHAWHCTCAFFALQAAAGGAGASSSEDDDRLKLPLLSDDGSGDAGSPLGAAYARAFTTPPCKHLLACLLAEQWRAGLGRYVVEGREAGPEALAGVVAGVIY